LFYFWSAAYVLALYAAILYFSTRNYRYWLLPIFGIVLVVFLFTTGHLMWANQLPIYSSYLLVPDVDFSSWFTGKTALIPILFLSLSLVGGLLFYLKLRKTLFKLKRVQMYCILMLMIATAAALLGVKTQPETWIITTFPLAVVAGNVIQENTHRLITELLLWALFLSPIVLAIVL
jgi:hypothetical protein